MLDLLPVAVKAKAVKPGAKLPEYQTEGAAGADLFSCIDWTIYPGETILFPTGICLEIPKGYEGQVRPRSGLALKYGISLANVVGTIDSDYRGEIGVILKNDGHNSFVVNSGMRIAQLVIAPVVQGVFLFSDDLSDTDRGDGGYGSTGR